MTNGTEPQAWNDARIREAFIDDGGQAEYHDPIDGAREHRRHAGAIFDAWLAARDESLRAALAKIDRLTPAPTTADVREALAADVLRADRMLPTGALDLGTWSRSIADTLIAAGWRPPREGDDVLARISAKANAAAEAKR